MFSGIKSLSQALFSGTVERLNHWDFNDLITEFRSIHGLSSHKLAIKNFNVQSELKDQSEEEVYINYFIYEDEYLNKDVTQKKKFVVFPITSDIACDQDKTPRPDLFFLSKTSDVIRSYCEKFPTDNATLLLPVHQCGSYLGTDKLQDYIDVSRLLYFISRDHLVLIEADLSTKQISTHDSIKGLASQTYLTQVIVPGFANLYISHGKQQDWNMCGYFVLNYIFAYLLSGNSECLANLEINQSLIVSKDVYKTTWEKVLLKVSKAIGITDLKLAQLLEKISHYKAEQYAEVCGEAEERKATSTSETKEELTYSTLKPG